MELKVARVQAAFTGCLSRGQSPDRSMTAPLVPVVGRKSAVLLRSGPPKGTSGEPRAWGPGSLTCHPKGLYTRPPPTFSSACSSDS